MRKTVGQLNRLQQQLVQRLPESAALIFEAHHMILKDPGFAERIMEHIKKGMSAPAAIRSVAQFLPVIQKQISKIDLGHAQNHANKLLSISAINDP